MNLNENTQHETNVAEHTTKSTAPIAPSVPTVRVLVAKATGMRAYAVLDLAEEHDIAIVLDNRRDHGNDIPTLERLLGPCYARLPGNPRISSLYIGKVTSITNTWSGQSSILVLADADHAEPLTALARAACEPHVTVELIKKVASSTRRERPR